MYIGFVLIWFVDVQKYRLGQQQARKQVTRDVMYNHNTTTG